MRYLLVLLLLTGCATQEERMAKYASQCDGFGFVRGTESHSHCMMEMQRRSQANAETMMGIGGAMATQPGRGSTICNQVGTTLVCN